MNYKKIFLIALMCATISCASAKIKKLVILHTNDTNSCVMPLKTTLKDTLVA